MNPVPWSQTSDLSVVRDAAGELVSFPANAPRIVKAINLCDQAGKLLDCLVVSLSAAMSPNATPVATSKLMSVARDCRAMSDSLLALSAVEPVEMGTVAGAVRPSGYDLGYPPTAVEPKDILSAVAMKGHAFIPIPGTKPTDPTYAEQLARAGTPAAAVERPLARSLRLNGYGLVSDAPPYGDGIGGTDLAAEE